MASISALPVSGYYGDGTSETELIAAARVDPLAFEGLYRTHEARIYSYMRVRTSSTEDAADLTQQVFLRALEAIPKYRERGLPFAAWLFRIAHNVAIDFQRRKRETVAWDALPEVLHPRSEQEPEAEVIRREELHRLRSLLAELEPDKRELVALRFVAKLSLKEIGVVVGKSEEAVCKQLSRTLHGLKEQYSGKG